MVLHSFVHQVIEYLIQLPVVPLVEQSVDSLAALLVKQSVDLLADLVFLLSASRSSTQDQTDHSQA